FRSSFLAGVLRTAITSARAAKQHASPARRRSPGRGHRRVRTVPLAAVLAVLHLSGLPLRAGAGAPAPLSCGWTRPWPMRWPMPRSMLPEDPPGAGGESRMRKLSVSTLVTLDGVIQDPGGFGETEQGGWGNPYFTEDAQQDAYEHLMASDYFLCGRVTYEL